jgi:hypothetical protein
VPERRKAFCYLTVKHKLSNLILSVSIPLCLNYCILFIDYRQHNKQLVITAFITACFDSHESSSGYVQNL